MRTPPKNRLIHGRDTGGLRYFLDGEPVHCGNLLELLVAPDRWLPVRYESRDGRPLLCIMVPPEPGSQARIQLTMSAPKLACLRWPGRR